MNNPQSTVLERGDVLFFYRPRVGTDEVEELEDVRHSFFVLNPDETSRYRQIVIGRKRLPDPDAHERAWAFVAEVAETPEELHDEVEAREYATKTRGTRFEPAARTAGEGRYAVAGHDGHTHLAYALELPNELGEVQRDMNIQKQASYIVAVKNPATPTPPGVGLPPHRHAELPDELRERFGRRRFAALDPPSLLDFEGAELVLIGAATDAAAELGIDLDPERERIETAEVFQELRLPREGPRIDPLQRGEWR